MERDRGSPQGSAISPLLANLFMHYAFDRWMRREFPDIGFERYCDDIVVHCVNQAPSRTCEGCNRSKAEGVSAGDTPGEDANRVLQGRQAEGYP